MGRLGGDSARGTPAPPPARSPGTAAAGRAPGSGPVAFVVNKRLAGGGGNGQVTVPSIFRNHLTGLL